MTLKKLYLQLSRWKIHDLELAFPFTTPFRLEFELPRFFLLSKSKGVWLIQNIRMSEKYAESKWTYVQRYKIEKGNNRQKKTQDPDKA